MSTQIPIYSLDKFFYDGATNALSIDESELTIYGKHNTMSYHEDSVDSRTFAIRSHITNQLRVFIFSHRVFYGHGEDREYAGFTCYSAENDILLTVHND